ncbi:hypothetical protein FHT70_005995 [Rhizobium sp. BK049]|uniref:hypothetical protein n=1 Tax=Rhizobium sp. BK049 TaxID=2587095 RepID=UPI00160ED2A4|nr:hypothetical protein [Rhizobium sp. BK049]MBB3356022.1 hypothetical protein [Rhizobium sp. BK049]
MAFANQTPIERVFRSHPTHDRFLRKSCLAPSPNPFGNILGGLGADSPQGHPAILSSVMYDGGTELAKNPKFEKCQRQRFLLVLIVLKKESFILVLSGNYALY